MNPPQPARLKSNRPTFDRPQNVPVKVAPPAVEDFSYERFAQTTGARSTYLSVWGWPWWYSDMQSAPLTGAFSTAFSSAFDGGVDSPQGSAFSTAFNNAFGA